MDKTTFTILAQGYIDTNSYDTDTYNAIMRVAKKYDVDRDFLGVTSGYGPAQHAIAKAISAIDPDEWLQYFVYDCDADFTKFNDRVENPDGTHPNLKNLEDLYDFIVKPFDFVATA